MEYVIAWIVMIIIGTKGSEEPEEVIRWDWEWRDGTECNVDHYPYVCTPADWWRYNTQDTAGCARITSSDFFECVPCTYTVRFLCNNATLTTPRSYIYVDALKTADSADSHCLQEYGTHLATIITEEDRAAAIAAYGVLQNGVWMGLYKKWSMPLAKYECDSRKEEIYYEDAEDLSDWIWDNDGAGDDWSDDDGSHQGYDDAGSQCAVGSCYYFYQYIYDYQGLDNYLPSYVSPPISTLGYSEISLSFYIRPYSSKTAVCTTSYSVDNATNYTLVHSATNPEGDSLEIMFKVSQRLGPDAANNNALRIRFQADDNLNDTALAPQERESGCIVDEIVVCGYLPTMEPTIEPTVDPTTAVPTQSTMQPTSHPTTPTSQPIAPPTSQPTEDEDLAQSMDKQGMVAIIVAVGFAVCCN
eukprot:1100153_1